MITVCENRHIFAQCEVKHDNRLLTPEEWKFARKDHIGASESAKVLGYSKYGSAMTVYADKHGLSEEFEGNIHTKFGTRMEGVIAEWLETDFPEETGSTIQIFEYPFQLVSKHNSFMAANLDRIAKFDRAFVDESAGVSILKDEWFPIEIKTASEMQSNKWEGEEVPTEYYIQCQHQMYVTGTCFVLLVYLVGKKLGWKFIRRNDSDIEMILHRINDFVDNYLVPKITPEPSGLADETAIILNANGLAEGDVYLPDADELIDQYDDVCEKISALETEKARIMQIIMKDKAGNKKCHGAERTFNSWEINRAKYDLKLLQAKYPEIHKEITKGVSTYASYRTGRVK